MGNVSRISLTPLATERPDRASATSCMPGSTMRLGPADAVWIITKLFLAENGSNVSQYTCVPAYRHSPNSNSRVSGSLGYTDCQVSNSLTASEVLVRSKQAQACTAMARAGRLDFQHDFGLLAVKLQRLRQLLGLRTPLRCQNFRVMQNSSVVMQILIGAAK